MSKNLITITTPQIAGALFNAQNSERELFVARDTKAKVVMTGYLGAGEVKEGEKYVPTAYGRLPVEAAKAGEGDKARLVLSIAGGALRGVLFKAKKADAKYEYQGNVEDGTGKEYPIFGRLMKSSAGEAFINISSMDKTEPTARGNGESSDHAGTPADSEVPF